MVFRNLSKTVVLQKLKLHNCAGKVKNAIINGAIAKKDELGEVYIQELELKHPSFAIRKKFYFKSSTESTAHLLGLGLVNIIILIIYWLESILDVKRELTTSVQNTMEDLVNSQIDFGPIETL